MNTVQHTVHSYYQSWAAQDLPTARQQLADDCRFRSPQDHLDSADEFIKACGHLAQGLKGVTFIREIYSDEEAFLILRWLMEDGASFMDAEYVKVNHEGIAEIIVLNNFTDFSQMLEGLN